MKKTAIVLLNLGGPSSPGAVSPFLFNLFYDKRIISLPNPFRFLLAKFISAKREKTAQEIYEQIGGKSPILENTEAQADALERMLNKDRNHQYKVFTCMRYWHPFANEVVKNVKQFSPDEVILLPLYPQYSTTTTLSSIEDWQKSAEKHELKCHTKKIIQHYHDNEDFIAAHAALIAKCYKSASKTGKPRVLFSAHSLPVSVIKKGDPYALQVEKSVELIVAKLAIKNLDWAICYQSKIGPVKWLEPSTESELLRAKNDDIPVVLSPISFVSEHSETLVELDIEYKSIIKNEYYFRVSTLSTDKLFIKCLADLCIHYHKMALP